MDCPLIYIGQTGQSFQTRYEEHIHAIKYGKHKYTYLKHILNTCHSYGNTQITMEIIQIIKNRTHEQP
jgi:hypothetical protein